MMVRSVPAIDIDFVSERTIKDHHHQTASIIGLLLVWGVPAKMVVTM
jgi:hypothetical protein